MEDYKQKCVDLYERYLRNHFRDAIDSANTKKHVDKLAEDEVFAHFMADPHAGEINEFMAKLNETICQEVLDKHLEEVLAKILTDIREIVGSILTDDDAQKLYEFVSSEVGQKVLRNLDIVRDTVEDATFVLTKEVFRRWQSPETSEMMMAFITSLPDVEEDEEDED